MWPFNNRSPHLPSWNRRAGKRRPALTLELLEKRELLAANTFLQGTAFIDASASNQLNASDARVSGATVQLYQGSSTTVLQTTTTDGNGNYLFTNVAPGSYRIVETPLVGYKNSGAQILSQLDPASQGVTSDTILVTVVDPNHVYANYNGTGNFEVANNQVNAPPDFVTSVGQLKVSLGTVSGATDLNAGYIAFCADDLHGLSFTGGEKFQVLPSPVTTITNGTSPISPANAGQIAYLFNHYASAPLTNIQAGALQLAMWELIYDVGGTADFASGNFQATFAPAYSAFTSAADFTTMANQAKAYFNEAKASAPELAIFLDNTNGTGSAPLDGDQGLLATESLNFANVPKATPIIVTSQQPVSALVGASVADKATVSGGSNPTGTVTFNLYNNANGTGTPFFTDANEALVNGVAVSNGYTATATGTDYWVATYNGDSNNNAVSSGPADEPVKVNPASPQIVTTASPAVTLDNTGAPTLSDSAAVSGGYAETGSLVFTLTGPGGFSYTQSDKLSGDGTYTASTTLPASGTVAGTYTWSVTYVGDANNNSAVDQGGKAEQTVVSPASPQIVTTASPAVTLDNTGAPTLSDSAAVSGGYAETGSLVFTLTGPGGFSYTQSDKLSGDGTYTASTTLPASGTVAGTYTWTVTYVGDANNTSAVDQGGKAEQTIVSPASPSILTTASKALTLDNTGAPTLSDSAAVSGGFAETGSLVFTLTGPGGFSYTQSDKLTGNGTYTASTALPAAGTVAGTYTWSVTYVGDANNNSAVDQGGKAEQTIVSAATPKIVTTASPAVTLDATGAPTLSDSAAVSGGYAETGSLVFTLTGPGGFSYTQSDKLSGDGTYTASTTLPASGTVAGTYTWTVTYVGDANNTSAVDQGGKAEQTIVSPASPSILTTASKALTLDNTGAPTLSDSAAVSGGFAETGSLVFTLTGPGGFSYTQSDKLSGDGTYTASTTLPASGTVAGTYTWSVTYVGDANNNSAVDQGGKAEQTVVSPASPQIVTTASPAVTLDNTGAPTLSDSAAVSGGFAETGSLVFTLTGPGGFSYTQSDKLSGDGTYTASTTLPASGTVAGTYTWSVTYVGDANNNSAVDQGGKAEQTVVSPASPQIVTTASPAVTLDNTGAPTLSDSAAVSGGYAETGSLVFTLTGPGGFSYTQSDKLSGDGTYTASTTLPASGTVAGTYTWTVTYVGDANNTSAVDQGGKAEQTIVSPASPSILTTASKAVTLDNTGAPTLSDSAAVSGGYAETGSLVFTLTGPGGFSYTQSDKLGGDGTYTASTTLPASGTVAGTYTWTVTYVGDANNTSAVDQGGKAEQTIVSAATPKIVTTASPAVTLDATGAPTLSDSAAVSGGFAETGSLVFTLTGPGGFSYTQSDKLGGDGTYTASTTLPASGTVAGTYTWTVTYVGDANNTSAVDQGGKAEQTIVSAATPKIVTTPGDTVVLGSGAKLTDTAKLSGGYSPTGTVTFNLYNNPNGTGTALFTDTETLVSGAATSKGYTPTVAGTDYWVAVYNGDVNNKVVASATGDEPETVTGATISGTKFNDVTGNGFSSDDTGLGGVTINLFKDVNGDGVLTSADGAAVATTTTAAGTGAFSFNGLAAGTYFVQEAVPAGYVQTAGGPLGLVGNTYYAVTVKSGDSATAKNFDDIQKCDDLLPGNTDVTNISYKVVDVGGTTTVTDLRGHTHQGDTVTVTFTVKAGDTETLTLVSYLAPGPTFDANTASQQQIYQVVTGTFTGGTHTLTATIPNCYYQIDFVCGAAIDHLGKAGSNIFYSAQGRLFSADNGGTRSCESVASGDFATIGFWHNRNGQALIDSLNGGGTQGTATALGNWLASTFPHLYGASADSTNPYVKNLAGATNAAVASFYLTLFNASGLNKTYAQIMAVALAAYATDTTLAGGNFAAAYGFNTSVVGTGIDVVNVGSNGSSIGLTNGSTQSVVSLLTAVDKSAGNKTLAANLSGANTIFSGINQVGDITLLASGSTLSVGASQLILTPASLATGQIWVAINGLDRVLGGQQETSIDAAIASLNAQLSQFGVNMIDVTSNAGEAAVADIDITFADTTVIGGVPEGVLGVTLFGGDVTLVNGWNWYYGSDSAQIGTDQYDFQTVATHELGHALGLGHSTEAASVMYPYLSEGETRRMLTDGDLSQIDADQNGAPEPLRAAPTHVVDVAITPVVMQTGGASATAATLVAPAVCPVGNLAQAILSGGGFTIAKANVTGSRQDAQVTPTTVSVVSGGALTSRAGARHAADGGAGGAVFIGDDSLDFSTLDAMPTAAPEGHKNTPAFGAEKQTDAATPSVHESTPTAPATETPASLFMPCDAYFTLAMSATPDALETASRLAVSAAGLAFFSFTVRDEEVEKRKRQVQLV